MKKLWIGLAVGALVGGVAALLFAPQSGASTRRKVRRSVEGLGDNLTEAAEYLKEQADRLSKEAQKIIDSSKSQLADAVDAAQDLAKTASSKVQSRASQLM